MKPVRRGRAQTPGVATIRISSTYANPFSEGENTCRRRKCAFLAEQRLSALQAEQKKSLVHSEVYLVEHVQNFIL